MTRRAPTLALLLSTLAVAALGCGGEAAARSDSAAGAVSPAVAESAAVTSAAAPMTDSAALTLATSRDSLRRAAHRHPPLAGPTAGALSAEAVQGVIDAINASDAALAGTAARKATDAEVKRFANMLASAHRQKVTETPPLKDQAGALVAPLRDIQAQSTATLGDMPAGAAFDRAFVQAQIDAHERAMAVLDSIRPAAQRDQLPALVADTRAEVARHLEQARALHRRLPP